jgi:uncharacterized protein (TIRG00374 family)
MKQKLSFGLGMLISLLCLYWVFSKVSWPELMAAISRIGFAWWIAAVILYMSLFIMRGQRWIYMLKPIKSIPIKDSIYLVIIGYTANNLLPFRLGELVRAHYLGKLQKFSRVQALASIAAERLLDGLTLIFILACSLMFVKMSNANAAFTQKILSSGAALFLGVAFCMVLFILNSAKLIALIKNKFPNAPIHILEKLNTALEFLRDKKLLLKTGLLGLVIWSLEGGMFVLIMIAMEIPNPISSGYLCFGLVNLGALIPSAPAYVGVYQAIAVLCFTILGQSEADGLAFAIVVHSAQFIPLTLTGIFLFIRRGERLSSFWSQSKNYET